MKSNKKRLKKVIALVLMAAVLAGGGAAGVSYLRTHRGSVVEVMPVSMINGAEWIMFGEEEASQGTIVSDVSQNVRVPDDKVVKEVYVNEGDTVRIGDKLLSYDTTLLELDEELQELNVQEIDLEIKSAEADLVKLKNTTPVERSSDDEDSLGSNLLDDLSGYNDDEARIINDQRLMLSTSQEPVTEGVPQTEPETQPQTQPQAVPETVSTDNSQSEKGQSEEEQVVSSEGQTDLSQEGSETIIENITPEDLNQSENGSTEYGDIENVLSKGEEGEDNKPKLNQRLNKFLENIRIKSVGGQEEQLLADTKEQADPAQRQIGVGSEIIKIIPHFKEDGENHFEKLNTYSMLIKGIHLNSGTLAGKIYGAGEINGNDYPEIGGFTLAQYTDSGAEDVVRLTLAFHEGLDQQHGIAPELADMYLEISLQPKELVGESLVFRTSDKAEEDVLFPMVREDNEETSTEEETEEIVTENVPIDSADNSVEQTTEPATEPTTEPVSGNTTPISELYVNVKWDHGTNDRANWPDSLNLEFYESRESFQEGVAALFSKTVAGVYNEDGGSNQETGDEEPETEAFEEITTESESETETAEESEPRETIVDQGDPYPSLQQWSNVKVDLTGEAEILKNLTDGFYLFPGIIQNYQPAIRWDPSTVTCSIEMKYVEPDESPLIKLNPLTELTYATGAEGSGKWYKGSGTEEDPYVFFCVDGAIIRSSFINWVLGFNEDGTTRLNEGCHVILEIRESDTITGAFIKRIGLDGTILMEYGYGPGTYWIFTSDAGMVRYEEEIPEDGGDFPDGGGDPGWEDIGETYTAEELAYAIRAKEKEIRKLKVDKKEAELKLKKYNEELEESTVLSAVNGYVKSVGENLASGQDAYMVVTGDGGLYLQSSVSELDLGTVEKGQLLSCTSWETGAQFSATITNIDYFPSTSSNDSFWSSNTNTNASQYPMIAAIDDAEGLSEYESVNVQMVSSGEADSDAIYLEKAYIRSENGQSYVYKQDGDQRLKKQYIRTGGSRYGYVEVKEGLSTEDKIAFPYGKSVKEGAGTVDTSEDEY